MRSLRASSCPLIEFSTMYRIRDCNCKASLNRALRKTFSRDSLISNESICLVAEFGSIAIFNHRCPRDRTIRDALCGRDHCNSLKHISLSRLATRAERQHCTLQLGSTVPHCSCQHFTLPSSPSKYSPSVEQWSLRKLKEAWSGFQRKKCGRSLAKECLKKSMS